MRCVLAQEDVVPFVSMIVAFLAVLIIGFLKLFKYKLNFKNSLIAIVTPICLGQWIYLLYLTGKDAAWQSTVILGFGLSCNYLLNGIFFCLYMKVICPNQQFIDWQE